MEQEKWQCRIAPSLGEGFSGTPFSCWGTLPYNRRDYPTVFWGLYGLPDFYAAWRHKGKKCILWCGSDICHFVNGYWLDNNGHIKISANQLAPWINLFCENYVENEVEQKALKSVGVESEIIPSFLGEINNYEICYNWSEKPKVYTSISGNDFKLYGWDKLGQLAYDNPDIEFHCYGNTAKCPYILGSNVVIHGRVSQEQMDRETKQMQGALRLTEFDGFSELIAKSLLWGQHPISLIKYPHTLDPKNISNLRELKKPNIEGRNWLLSIVNKYPWNQK